MVTLLSIDIPILSETPYSYRSKRRGTTSKLLVARDLSNNETVSFWEEVRKGDDLIELNHLGKATLSRLRNAPIYIVINAILHAWCEHRAATIPETPWNKYLNDLFLLKRQSDFNIIPKLQGQLDNMATDMLVRFFEYLGEKG